MTDVIGSVGLLVKPITTKFAQETQAQVKRALEGIKVDAPTANFDNVERSAKKAKDGIVTSFNQAAGDSNKALGGVGNNRTFASAERSASVAAANIRRTIEKAAFEADQALGKIGGGGRSGGGKNGRGGDGGPGDLESLIAGAAGLAAGIKLIKIPVVIEGVTAALGALSSLSAGVLALAGALSTLSGAAVAIPAIYSALGQAFGVVKLASGGVTEALKAHGQEQTKSAATAAKSAREAASNAAAQEAAAERIIDATQSLARAQQNLESSQKSLVKAQEALNNSYYDASEAIEDAQFASAGAILGEERARLSIARTELAQQRLNDARKEAVEQLEDLKLAMEGSALSEQRARIRLEEALRREAELREQAARTGLVNASDLASAGLAVREAELAIREIIEGRVDQQTRLSELQEVAAGKDQESALASQESALAVREAQLGLLQAIDRRLDTQKTLAEMEEKGIARSDIVVRAQEAFSAAQLGVSNATEGVADAQRGLARALQASADAAKEMGESGAGAMDTFKEAMKGLGPNATAFVNRIIDMKDRIKTLRDVAAENLFGGVNAGLDAVLPLFTDLEPVVRGTALEMGALAKKAGELVGSRAWRTDLVQIGRGNITILRNLGDAGLNLVSALKDILVVGQPLAIFMSGLTSKFSQNLTDTVAAARSSGGLLDFFEKTKSTLLDVIDITGSLFGTLKSLFSAGFPEGARYLFDLRLVFENLEGLVNGAVASGSLQSWFEDARPSVEAIAGIISDLVSGLVRIGAEVGPALAPVLEQIRSELVPAVLGIIDSINTDFLSALVGLATQAAKFVDTFMQATPALTAVVTVLDGALRLVNFLGTELGPVSTALVNILAALTALGTVNAAFNLARIISNFAGLRKGIDLVQAAHARLGLSGMAAGLGVLGGALVVGTLAWGKYQDSVAGAGAKMEEIKSRIQVNDIESINRAIQEALDVQQASVRASEESGLAIDGFRGKLNTFTASIASGLGLDRSGSNKEFLDLKAAADAAGVSIEEFKGIQQRFIENVGRGAGEVGKLGAQFGLTRDEIIKLANANNIDLSESFDKIKGPIGEALKKTQDSVLASSDLSNEYAILGSAASTVTEKFDAFNTALDKTLGITLTLFDAETAEARALDALEKAYEAAAGKASLHSDEGLRLRDALTAATRSIGEKAKAAIEDSKSSVEAKARAAEYIVELQALQNKFPGLKTEIQGFIDKIVAAANAPTPVVTPVVNTAQAMRAVSDLDRALGDLQRRLDMGIAFNAGNGVRFAARGAILDRPTMLVAGEAGKEVVLPLTDARRTLELANESGLFEVLGKAIGSSGSTPPPTMSRSFTPPPTTAANQGVVFGPGSIVVELNGSATPEEATNVGERIGHGIIRVMASQEAIVEARAL